MKTYRVRAEREGRFWLLTMPELDVMTQARRLTEADEMARDLIATWLDIAPDSFAIDLDVALPDELAERRGRARQLREEADRLTGCAIGRPRNATCCTRRTRSRPVRSGSSPSHSASHISVPSRSSLNPAMA